MKHPTPIGSTVLGLPRIGRDRQLKFDLERYWRGDVDAAYLERTAAAIRFDWLYTASSAGLDAVPVNTFSYYDHVLDTAVMVGAVPERHQALSGEDRLVGDVDAARYFAMARGTADVTPLEMTKWFDTNYHYLVPEIGPGTTFALAPGKVLAEVAEAAGRSVSARPVVVGPWTFLSLAKADATAPPGFEPLERLDDLVAVYVELLGALHTAGVEWVQLDEPSLVRELSSHDVARFARVLERLTEVEERPAILLTTPFGAPIEALPSLAASGIEGLAIDLVRGPLLPPALSGLSGKHLVLGVVDGRNVWRNDLDASLAALDPWRSVGAVASVATSCSLLHVPYDVRRETDIEPALRDNLAFADQKVLEVVALQRALESGADAAPESFAASRAAREARPSITGLRHEPTRERLAALDETDRERTARGTRRATQDERLGLPALPTTTIGSFPQTAALRTARAGLRTGSVQPAEYREAMRQEIREVILLQEELGLDVLVHGEPERNDMVQYFAEQLAGYVATQHGWVQSYGSRCVRPPILYGDVHRPEPMTVEWATFAQGLTAKPVKGMLTGPVTLLAWSFVRDDQPRSETADQVALALRDEVSDLEDAGLAIIQVDEPALRETLPLRRSEQGEYLRWAVGSFRLATAGVEDSTQVHTHLCYSEFGEIIDAIDGLDADVTSIEAARSQMELLDDVASHGFGGALGPGVYDIHSPRVPGRDEMVGLLDAALRSLSAGQLWVNPDCGLKTRRYEEVKPALQGLVAAARRVREKLEA